MQPPLKDHRNFQDVDDPQLDASNGATVVQIDYAYENKDTARQEFAKEADINHMLSRFGVVPERGTPTFGEWDETLDLQQAITSVAEAKAAFERLPEELRKKFNNMEEVLAAYNNGGLVIKNEDAPEVPKTEVELLQERIDALQKRIDEQKD